MDDGVVLPSNKLYKIQMDVVTGIFNEEKYPKISMQNAHAEYYGRSPGGWLKCGCRKGKLCSNAWCKCEQKKQACTSSCACRSQCMNMLNDK